MVNNRNCVGIFLAERQTEENLSIKPILSVSLLNSESPQRPLEAQLPVLRMAVPAARPPARRQPALVCSTTRQPVQPDRVLIPQINANATAKKAERRLKCHWITSPQPKHLELQMRRPLVHSQYLVLGDSPAPPLSRRRWRRSQDSSRRRRRREGGKAEQLHGDCASYSSLDSVRVETSSV